MLASGRQRRCNKHPAESAESRSTSIRRCPRKAAQAGAREHNRSQARRHKGGDTLGKRQVGGVQYGRGQLRLQYVLARHRFCLNIHYCTCGSSAIVPGGERCCHEGMTVHSQRETHRNHDTNAHSCKKNRKQPSYSYRAKLAGTTGSATH